MDCRVSSLKLVQLSNGDFIFFVKKICAKKIDKGGWGGRGGGWQGVENGLN